MKIELDDRDADVLSMVLKTIQKDVSTLNKKFVYLDVDGEPVSSGDDFFSYFIIENNTIQEPVRAEEIESLLNKLRR